MHIYNELGTVLLMPVEFCLCGNTNLSQKMQRHVGHFTGEAFVSEPLKTMHSNAFTLKSHLPLHAGCLDVS